MTRQLMRRLDRRNQREISPVYVPLLQRVSDRRYVGEGVPMMIVRFFAWCRDQFFGVPRRQRLQEQSVLAWRVPRSLLRDNRRR